MSDDKLDVTTEEFDADACLAVADPSMVRLPYPDTKELPNLFAATCLVPPSIRAEVELLSGKVEKTEQQRRQDEEKRQFMCKRAAEYMHAIQKAATQDPIETLVKRVRKGPLMLLKRAYTAGCEIDIVTRHGRGVRGVIRAKLHGFDKFMNMLLADAHELFVVRARVERELRQAPEDGGGVIMRYRSGVNGEEAVPKTRSGWKQVFRQRKLSRILLRGDQVVTVTFASGPLELPSRLRHVTPPATTTELEAKEPLAR
eukprot:jgi/Ulvmu1/8753/UM048_0007.1